MYTPPKFKSTDTDAAFALMGRYPFATVVTVKEGEPVISHLPLTPVRVDGKIELIGHLARANPHARVLAESTSLAIFHGAHTYITPQWYEESDVPTWNYSVVHARGKVEVIDDYGGLVECLQTLTEHVEKGWPSGWKFFVPDDLKAGLTKSIVGFRLTIEDLTFKRKLSQNRSEVDQAGVLKGLKTRTDDQSREVLAEMLALSLQKRPL